MTLKTAFLAFSSFILSVSISHAAVIDSSSTGLASPDQLIAFDEVGGLTGGDVVTNQFAGLGVTFSPNLFFITQFSPRDNFTTPALANFGSAPIDPFSILFENDVTDASFAFSSNQGTAVFTALLNGVIQETFASSDASFPPLYYGFTGIVFDEIRVDVNGNSFALIDNLAYNIAEIPLPAALPLFLAGIAGLGFARRKRAVK